MQKNIILNYCRLICLIGLTLSVFCENKSESKVNQIYSIAMLHLSIDESNNQDSIFSQNIIFDLDSILHSNLVNNFDKVINSADLKEIKAHVVSLNKHTNDYLRLMLIDLNKKNCKYLIIPKITANNYLLISMYSLTNKNNYGYQNKNYLASLQIEHNTTRSETLRKLKERVTMISDSITQCIMMEFGDLYKKTDGIEDFINKENEKAKQKAIMCNCGKTDFYLNNIIESKIENMQTLQKEIGKPDTIYSEDVIISHCTSLVYKCESTFISFHFDTTGKFIGKSHGTIEDGKFIISGSGIEIGKNLK